MNNDVGFLHQKIDDLTHTVNRLSQNLDNYITSDPKSTAASDASRDERAKKEDKLVDFSGDENEARGNWSGRLDFFLACLGYAVGLGNVWRFPYLCYRNGGAVFFIPYVIMLTIVGVPIFLLELALGQYTSSGPFTCWKMAPIFKGVGVGMVLVSLMVGIYYNMIIAWALFFLFGSFTSELPWEKCDPSWATKYCADYLPNMNTTCFHNDVQYTANPNGLCYNGTEFIGMWNKTVAAENNITRSLPAEDYLTQYVWNIQPIDDIGTPKWQLVLCLLLAWIIVGLSLSKGIKSSGKVVYFTALFPYVVLIILLVRGLTLDGYFEGIKFYILQPKIEKLADARVWKDAAVQIFFSLSASWGGLITLASYNRFHTNVLRDALLVSISNCLTSFFAGFVVFSFLGYLAKQLEVPVEDVVQSGVGLAFSVYPAAVTSIPVAPLWSILFFLMLITLGLDSEFALVETVTTAVLDQWPKLRKFKTIVIISFCAFMFVMGLPLTCPGGSHVLTIMDDYAGGWNVLVISFLECVCISYVYGVNRFCDDIGVILGTQCNCLFPWKCCNIWWKICWVFLTPIGVLFILIFNWVDYSWSDYPRWADGIGWCLSVVVVVAIFVTAIGMIIFGAKGSFVERIRTVTTFDPEGWGPALVKHRKLVHHLPGFVVDPYNSGTQYADEVDPGQIKMEMGHSNLGFD